MFGRYLRTVDIRTFVPEILFRLCIRFNFFYVYRHGELKSPWF